MDTGRLEKEMGVSNSENSTNRNKWFRLNNLCRSVLESVFRSRELQ
jgi:hypothetical protein